MVFKHSDRNTDKATGFMHYFWMVIDFPLNLLRDLTIPAGDSEKWDRTKMAFVPFFFTFSLFFLYGFLDSIWDEADENGNQKMNIMF